MAGLRKVSAGVLILVMTALAMLAWWSMLAAERAAIRATEDGARQAATIAAVSLALEPAVDQLVDLAERTSGARLLLRDADGDVLGGKADPGAQLVTVEVPGRQMTVSAEVSEAAGLGLGRYSRVISVLAFTVMAVAFGLLTIVSRDRRRAHAELERLGQRWDEVAAADDLTGLGNRQRLLEDVDALIARGSRYGNSFGLALFELEGEPSDGLVLAVAGTVAEEARGGDLCYRLGGGRFVSLLPEQDETGAALAADRVRRILIERLGQPVRTGAAAFSPWLPCTSADLLLRAELDLGTTRLMAEDDRPQARTGAPIATY